MMNKKQIEDKAKELRKQFGGMIFGFPIEEDNPFSEYAVVVFAGNKYFVYPKACDISTAAVGVQTIIEQFRNNGTKIKFSDDVRLISYNAQMNAPSVVMRRLKNDSSLYNILN